MGIEITSLKTLIESYKAENVSLSDLAEAFSSFHCKNNLDEETFLKEKAIDFELKNKARTYLVFDNDNIIAYFSLAFKSIDLKNVSTNLKKKMTAGESCDTYPAFLIGHIAKNDNVPLKLGNILLDIANNLFYQAQLVVGGRLVYLDCKDIPKLRKFYENNGFKLFKQSETTGLLQYYKKL